MGKKSVAASWKAVVLIGGESARMGAPKSLLKAGDQFVLERIVAVARVAASEVVLAGRAPVPRSLAKIRRLRDVPGIAGPLAGLLAAFRHDPRSGWIALSCDLPFITAGALRWLLSKYDPDCTAVLPHLDSAATSELIFALYGPRAGDALEAGARSGERSIRCILIPELPGQPCEGLNEPSQGYDAILSPRIPNRYRSAFKNVNTPEEWRAALARVRRRLR